jgi:hypothetical protein
MSSAPKELPSLRVLWDRHHALSRSATWRAVEERLSAADGRHRTRLGRIRHPAAGPRLESQAVPPDVRSIRRARVATHHTDCNYFGRLGDCAQRAPAAESGAERYRGRHHHRRRACGSRTSIVTVDFTDAEEHFLPFYPVLEDARRISREREATVCVPPLAPRCRSASPRSFRSAHLATSSTYRAIDTGQPIVNRSVPPTELVRWAPSLVEAKTRMFLSIASAIEGRSAVSSLPEKACSTSHPVPAST